VHSNLNDQTNTKQGGTHLLAEDSFSKVEGRQQQMKDICFPIAPLLAQLKIEAEKTVDSVNTLCTPTAQF
jgi:hypothetical protein